MNLKPTRADAMQLLMEGAKALAQMEVNGICIDMDYLKKAEKDVQQKIRDLEDELRQDEVYKLWEKTYGSDMKLGSDRQLGFIFFEKMGHIPIGYTESGKYKTDKHALEKLDHPFARTYITWKELQKALGTYIHGLIDETVDGFVHPHTNQHTVRSFRSSQTKPNLQNIPTRNPLIAEIVRRAVVPRGEDRVILELDYNMQEVRAGCPYHKDKELIRYCNDDKADMHRDQAIHLFLLPVEEIVRSKDEKKKYGDLRFYAKNQFVFATFYGSFFKQCAPNLWESMDRFDMKLKDGTPIKQHFRHLGIEELGHCVMDQDDPHSEVLPNTFEYVVMQAEKKLWEQFSEYAAWKRSWWDGYCKKGYVEFLTGFQASGVMKKNDTTNYPIQAVGYHCLLWVIIKMHKWLKKNKMKSLVINEIHDSCLYDCTHSEVLDVIAQHKYYAEEAIREEWPWINVPLKIETEICQQNWFEKKEFDPKKWRV